MGLLWSIIIGILAGFIAGKLMRGKGLGLIVNLIVGIIGASIGGWLFTKLNIMVEAGFVGSLITSTVGAIVLLFIIGIFTGGNKKR
ncbi:GlsB/YeaQ/YmgE family stress response membrane protein [Bernardetia sp. Wsw4-3y2]|uniref:GlsB/YeaQ/YmgE family stress response membrane protein n=1 Tax=unclassified Bernardetia TaxID=2647129 RepID=UPI0030CDD7E2